MAGLATAVGIADLWEHYLTCPLSDGRWVDSQLVITVRGDEYDRFCDVAQRCGWEIIDSHECTDETMGYADVTVRRAA